MMAKDRKEYFREYQKKNKEKYADANKRWREGNLDDYRITQIKSHFKSLDKEKQKQVLDEVTTIYKEN